MYESKYTSLIHVSVVSIGTDRIVNGLTQFVQADNPGAVDNTIRDFLERMPKDGTCELTVNYLVD